MQGILHRQTDTQEQGEANGARWQGGPSFYFICVACACVCVCSVCVCVCDEIRIICAI